MRASATVIIIDDRAGDQGARDERPGRKPEPIVLAIPSALIAVAFMPVVVSGITASTKVAVLPVTTLAVVLFAPFHAILHLDYARLDTRCRRHESRRSMRWTAGECESCGQAART